MTLGPDISGPTGESCPFDSLIQLSVLTRQIVWSMPGGFTSSGREGYASR